MSQRRSAVGGLEAREVDPVRDAQHLLRRELPLRARDAFELPRGDDHAVDARHQFRRGLLVASQERDLVLVARALQGKVAEPTVGVDDAARFHGVVHKRHKAVRRSVRYSTHSNSADARSILLSRNYNPPTTNDASGAQYVVMQLRIARDGRILSLAGGRLSPSYIKKSSPNQLVNYAAERAVLASNPLPPFPNGFLLGAQEAVAEIWFRYPK